MTSPYSVASLTRIASRTSASPMSRGRSVTTSCAHPEVGGEATRIREVLAALGADGERDAVRVHLAHVSERQ